MVSLLMWLLARGFGPVTEAEGKRTFSAHRKKLPDSRGNNLSSDQRLLLREPRKQTTFKHISDTAQKPGKLVYPGDTARGHSVFPLFTGSEVKKCRL